MATAAEQWLQAISLQRQVGIPTPPDPVDLPSWPPLDPPDPEQDDIDQAADIQLTIDRLQELYFRRPMD